jgi:hypothetical protein
VPEQKANEREPNGAKREPEGSKRELKGAKRVRTWRSKRYKDHQKCPSGKVAKNDLSPPFSPDHLGCHFGEQTIANKNRKLISKAVAGEYEIQCEKGCQNGGITVSTILLPSCF